MATYSCTQRTNYFHVKDPEKFRELMGKVAGEDFRFWERNDHDGNPMFAFGAEGDITGLPDEDRKYDENAFDDLVTRLCSHVADGEAVILLEAGREGFRYVTGTALIITGKGTDFIDLSQAAVKLAGEMLGRPDYSPRMGY